MSSRWRTASLVPVKYPDPSASPSCRATKRAGKVIANTRALLAGMPANNVLLYGDAGTGKSSAVKAIANEFAPEGLRLVEVKKNQLYQIPDLMDKLAANPLKFILFIDDLSFTANDDNFAALKAILEGSVGGRAQNVAVLRHLQPPPPHQGDPRPTAPATTSTKPTPGRSSMSLSARFGLTVTFQRPEKARVRGHPRRAGQAAPHPRCPYEQLLRQGRGLCHPRRRPQPPRGQAVHRAVRGRRAEASVPNAMQTGHQSIRRCSGVPLLFVAQSRMAGTDSISSFAPWGWLPPARSCERGTARQRPWRTLRSLRQNR